MGDITSQLEIIISKGDLTEIANLINNGLGNGLMKPDEINDVISVIKRRVEPDMFDLLMHKLDSYGIRYIIERADKDRFELLLPKLNLTKLDSYDISCIIGHADKDRVELLLPKLDLTKLDSYDIRYIIKHADKERFELTLPKLDLTKLDPDNLVLFVQILARNGKVDILQKLGKYIDTGKIPLDQKKNFFESTKQSCFGKPDDLQGIDREKVAQPLTVAQNFCDTMVRLKNGNVLVVKGHEAREVYNYLSAPKSNEQTNAHKLFTIYVRPGHGFLEINDKTWGFYPDDSKYKNALNHDYTAEIATHSLLAGITFVVGLGLFSMPGLVFSIPKLIPAFLGGLTSTGITAYAYKFHSDYYMPAIDHKLGTVVGEYDEKVASDQNNNLNISFIVTHDQATSIQQYIHSVHKGCIDNNPDKCMYNFITRNCLGFIQDAFKEANFSGHYTDFFTKEQFSTFSGASFTEAYSTKALFYGYAKKSLPTSATHIFLDNANEIKAVSGDIGQQQDTVEL